MLLDCAHRVYIRHNWNEGDVHHPTPFTIETSSSIVRSPSSGIAEDGHGNRSAILCATTGYNYKVVCGLRGIYVDLSAFSGFPGVHIRPSLWAQRVFSTHPTPNLLLLSLEGIKSFG